MTTNEAGAQAADPWFARLAFTFTQGRGPVWMTLWLVIVLAALIALGLIVGPWVPASIGILGGAGVGARALATMRRYPPSA